MNKASKILYLAHSKPGSYIFRTTEEYLAKFPDVEIRGISENPHPFPKCVEEITLSMLFEAMDLGFDQEFFSAVQRAQDEGYGAAVCASNADFALGEAREKLSIPYIGLGWASYWKAASIAGRFTHLHTHMPELIAPFSIAPIDAYGFGENLVSVEYIKVDIYRAAAKEEEPDLNEIMDVTEPRVKRSIEKGARAFTIGCGSPELSRFAHMLNDLTMAKWGVPVLAPVDTAVTVAREFLEKKRA